MVPTSAKGYLSPSAYQMNNHVVMIPCGGLSGENPFEWKASALKYYSNYILNNAPIDRMFGGFIFNGIRTRESHMIHPLYVGFGKPSEMTDWLAWIDNLFATDSNLHALYQTIGIGKEPRDVWISIPYPHPYQRSFGKLRGRQLDFSVENDRAEAVEWWMDEFIGRWKKSTQLHGKLRFQGFLWQRESVDAGDENVVRSINAAIRQRKLLSMWLPNYGSAGVINWTDLGFHVVLLNCNYTGNTSYDTSWIRNTNLFARHYHTGIQITWGKGLIYNRTHQLDYFNKGLPGDLGYMQDSFLVYQFPNQSLEHVYKENIVDYIRLYTFIKGLYTRINYPGIPY